MARRDDIVTFTNELLDVRSFPEHGRPGLQVVGAEDVSKVVCAVSSSRELFEQAAAAGAQLVLVHHGLFWRNEPLVVDRRLKGRLEALFRGDLSLVAYHLALDAHAELGNNALLAERLGARRETAFAEIGAGARFDEPVDAAELARRLQDVTGREPLVFAHGPERIERVAIVTGGGGTRLIEAAHELLDRIDDRGRSLAYHEVTAVGDDAERRAQAARVLESVCDRHLRVTRPVQDERRARHTQEVEPRISPYERVAGAAEVGVQAGAGEEAARRGRRERPWIGRGDAAERQRAQAGVARHLTPPS